MKIDIDTLIYIIVMIVFIVLGALGKKKKPVQQAVVPPVTEDETEEFISPEDVIAEKLKAFIGDYNKNEILDTVPEEEIIISQKETIQDRTVFKNEHPQVENQKTILAGTEDLLDKVHAIHDEIQEGIPVFKEYNYDDHSELVSGDLTKSENQPDTDPHHQSVLNEIYEDFNLKKAVIFSEIMGRKQF